MSPSTASRRRAVRRLISSTAVASQQQLVDLLGGEGFEVTQATVSRDLDAIGAVKRDENGTSAYRIPETTPTSVLGPGMAAVRRAVAGFVDSIEPSGNLIVMKTPPGGAHLVAGAIDNAGIDGVLGTVAGDDTLLVVAASDREGEELAKTFENIGADR